jgi:Pentapeptide repeats (8 copies)
VNFFGILSKPKPVPCVVIKNVLGQVLLQIPGRYDLIGANLRGLNLAHADLSNMSLDGANWEGINLFGARLVKTSFTRCNLRDAEVSFSDATGANFSNANLDGCKMYRTETSLARFDACLLSESSDIPGMKVTSYRDCPTPFFSTCSTVGISKT